MLFSQNSAFWCGLACPLVRLPAFCFSNALPRLLPCDKTLWFATLPPQLQTQFCVFSSMCVPSKLKVPKLFHWTIPMNCSVLWLIALSWSLAPFSRRTTEEIGRRSCFICPQDAESDHVFLFNLLVQLLFLSQSVLGLESFISLTEICSDYSELYLSLKKYILLRVLLKSFE